MKAQDYAYAVAAVRTLSNAQLTEETMDRLWTMDAQGIKRLLQERGWHTELEEKQMCTRHKQQAWSKLMQWAPQPEALWFLVVHADFHNAAASLLAHALQTQTETLWQTPCLVAPQRIERAVEEQAWKEVPRWLRDPMLSARQTLHDTMDGQAAAAQLHRAGFAAALAFAEQTGDVLLVQMAQAMAMGENYKLARQGALQGAKKTQISAWLCFQNEEEANAWAGAATQGTKALAEFWRQNGHGPAADRMQTEPGPAFEAWCDGLALVTAQKAAWQAFGPGPLAAYYLQAVAESTNVDLALTALKINAMEQAQDRRRALYG